jgi:poly(A) polymerase Pap1
MATDPRLGVTPTMSTDPPTAQDLKLDEALLQELKSRGEFEAQEETKTR